MSKDINIHIKTPGADQAKQQLKDLSQNSRQVGQQTAAGAKQGAAATEQSSQKLSGMSRILGSLKTQVMGFVGAWLGLQGVQKLVSWLIDKLERIAALQKEIYEKAVSLGEIGQGLEFQTGTKGKQQFWTEEALKLQEAGGLKSPDVARQMLVSMDIAFSKQGGIINQQVRDIAAQLAPFIGAGGLGGEEVGKVFEFAKTAKVAPTVEAYQKYFAQLWAGFTSTNTQDFGQFMVGLQQGGTGYISAGGSLEEAISTFSGARSVVSNEALAATLLEQTTRLSSGAYERPRQAIEEKLGVSWSGLSMDQRKDALLQFVQSFPESERTQKLAEFGFPVELASQLGKMVTTEAQGAIAATREKVAGAKPTTVDEMGDIYTESMLGKKLRTEARDSLRKTKRAPKFAGWQDRLKSAGSEFDDLKSVGKDAFFIKDEIEPALIALEQLEEDIDSFIGSEPDKEKKQRANNLKRKIRYQINLIKGPVPGTILPANWFHYPASVAKRQGQSFTEQFEELQQSSNVTVNHTYNNNTNFYPKVGDDQRGPSFTQD